MEHSEKRLEVVHCISGNTPRSLRKISQRDVLLGQINPSTLSHRVLLHLENASLNEVKGLRSVSGFQ